MPDYSKGVIYTIRCRYDTSLIYVGSTIQPLAVRWGNHKRSCFNEKHIGYNMLIYQKIRETSWNDWYIELYEEHPCDNVQQLHKREGEVIREIGTLNKYIAGREKNQYYEDNKEKHNEKHKEYYEQNKQKIVGKTSEKIQCGCGSIVRRGDIARHCKSQKHLNWEATQTAASNS